MQYPKRAGFIVAAICFMFFTACEGERAVSNSSDENPFVQISIKPMESEKLRLGESRTIPVTTRNTGFTLSVRSTDAESNPSDAGCVKNGGNVVCTPVNEGKYDIRVTATADTKKSASTTITVELASISISPVATSVKREETAVFTVNTNGSFALSASPSLYDANCGKVNGNRVLCAPDLAGTYAITVTADDNTTDTAILTALIGISPLKQSVNVKEEFAVFNVNATDFKISTSPEDGITCGHNGSEVVCVPIDEGVYIITVTVNGDSGNKDEALLIGVGTGKK